MLDVGLKDLDIELDEVVVRIVCLGPRLTFGDLEQEALGDATSSVAFLQPAVASVSTIMEIENGRIGRSGKHGWLGLETESHCAACPSA